MKTFLKPALGFAVLFNSFLPTLANAEDVENAGTRAIVVSLFEAFNRHDLEGVVALYHADAKLVTPNFPDPRYGLKVVREEYKNHFDNIPGVHDEVTRIVADGDHAAVEFTASWEQPTESDPDARGVLQIATFLKIKDGKIIEDITYFDRMDFEPVESD